MVAVVMRTEMNIIKKLFTNVLPLQPFNISHSCSSKQQSNKFHLFYIRIYTTYIWLINQLISNYLWVIAY